MPVLVAALTLVGLIATVNLLLSMGIIKRLREHTELLGNLGGGPASLVAGEAVGEFSTVTVDDRPLDRESLTGETVVGFFSPTCQPCKEKLPTFIDYARTRTGGDRRALAVVVGDAEQAADFVSRLSPVVRVVLENPDGPMSLAFKTRAFPTVLAVAPDDDGRLVVTDDHFALDQPAALV
ncbi:TlpA family protein disulfide reductase [Micromonospora sp. NPDC001898]|uniref:TlpA family protein disulfide reductase n=1 Tax=Micromonospora sp. NPDC001898 TaxID=3364221 RepID=UPI00367FD18F